MIFQPLFPLWAVISVFFLLLAGLAWMETRRRAPWLRIRLVALTLALLSIAALVLNPAREKVGKENRILLLTNGFDTRLVDSLRAEHPDWRLVRTPDAGAFPGSRPLTDLVELSMLGSRVGAIVGDGLPAYALEYFTEKHFQYFPSRVREGIVHLEDKLYRERQVNRVEGAYFLRETPVKLLLNGPAGKEDSVLLEKPGRQPFELAFTPRSDGRWLYQLLAIDSTGGIVGQEKLPVVVSAEKQLRVLIWQAYPTFEGRYLNNFLVDRGHAVAMRSRLSRDKYRSIFANLPRRDMSRLDHRLLEDFDLVVMDAAAYDLLSRGELADLFTAVEEGVGFLGLVAGDDAPFDRWIGLTGAAPAADTVRLAGGLTFQSFLRSASSEYDWYQVHSSAGGQPVAAYRYQGRGKVGFQSVRETYPRFLEGDSLAYAAFWMPVLEEVRRETYPEYTIELLDGFPVFAGHPLDFRMSAAGPVEAVYADSVPVPIREDYALDDVWYGRVWPGEEGWREIRAGEVGFQYYAFSSGNWTSLADARQRRLTAIEAPPAAPVEGAALATSVLQPLPRLWFYLLFLCCAGFLWLAPKL
jgi:hypothetical protein